MQTSSAGGSYHRRGKAIRVHFVTHRPDALQALRERCRESPPFRRLLEAAGHDLVRRGRLAPVLTGNTPQAKRALAKAVSAFSDAHRAWLPEAAVAGWSYLTPKKCKVGDRRYRVLAKVSKLEARCMMHQEPTLDGFQVRRLLGYAPNVSWRAAARLNQLHGPPSFYLVPEPEDPRDDAFDLDLNENEHFRDDRGFYDEAGVLQPFRSQEPECWETGYASREEAWNRTHSADVQVPVPTRFYPASAAKLLNRGLGRTQTKWRIDHHGVSELLRHREHRHGCQCDLEHLEVRQQQARALPDAPLYHADLKTAQKNLLEREHIITQSRRAELEADEAEVLAYADTDVPETLLELLEQQVEETAGKASCGLIAALAAERIKSLGHAEKNRQYVRGLAALDEAASRYVTA